MDFEVKEVRVGHYICIDNGVSEVLKIDENEFTVRDLQNEVFRVCLHTADIRPIKLTQDMLYSVCGFNNDGILKFEINEQILFLKYKDDHIILYTSGGIALVHFWEIKYLHRLQKLYHGLTGKPIEISIRILDCL